jgi:hypothetical protein
MDILDEYLKGHLYKKYDDTNLYIKDIKGKVLIKWPERHTDRICECKQFCLIKSVVSKDIKECKKLIKPEGFTGEHWTNMHQQNTKSYEHSNKKYKKDNTKFIRIYPPGGHTDSKNYPFFHYILKGVHLIALNIQTLDIHTLFQLEFFRKGCLRKIPELVNLKKEKFTITFSDDFSDIKIKINYDDNDDNDNNDNKILKGNKNEIELYKDFALIYIKCTVQNKKYRGVITLTEQTNKLYNIKLYNSCAKLSENNLCNCNWYNNEISNKENILVISCDNDNNNNNINIHL